MAYGEYVLNRLLTSAFVLFVTSIIIFSILRIIPGDPALLMLGVDATPEAIAAQRRRLGLNLPIWEQYIQWITQIVTLDLGTTFSTDRPVKQLLFVRYPRSVFLAFFSIGIAILIAIPFGVVSAVNKNSKIDYAALLFSQFGISLPNFVLGIFLIMIFSAQLDVLPATGYISPFESPTGFLTHITMPAITMGIINGAIITRFVRSEMLEQLNNDYVKTAKAFGHERKKIIRKYTLKNALIPTVTVIGIQFGGLIGGLVVVEQVFSFPGMGLLILDALFSRDYPVLQVGLLVIAATFIIVNLIVDLIYGFLDPKVKY